MGRYGIRDVFLTLQGEGARTGTKALFVRFTGCNLWDGMPLHRDRGIGACAKWCDTDFFKGKVYSTDELLAQMNEVWPPDGEERWCVLTGGEPCLQIDKALLEALHGDGWKVAIETNGTEENVQVERYADWICIAPKLDAAGEPLPLALARASEVKVVLPGIAHGAGAGWKTTSLLALEKVAIEVLQCDMLYVQPQDPIVSPDFVSESLLVHSKPIEEEQAALLAHLYNTSVQQCIAWVLAHPRWRMSVQQHKTLGLP